MDEEQGTENEDEEERNWSWMVARSVLAAELYPHISLKQAVYQTRRRSRRLGLKPIYRIVNGHTEAFYYPSDADQLRENVADINGSGRRRRGDELD